MQVSREVQVFNKQKQQRNNGHTLCQSLHCYKMEEGGEEGGARGGGGGGGERERHTHTHTHTHTEEVVCWLLHVLATCECILWTKDQKRDRDGERSHTYLPKISNSSAIPLWCSVS